MHIVRLLSTILDLVKYWYFFVTIFCLILYIWCFHFILSLIKSFIQGGSLSSNVTSLLGTKLEEILIIGSLKIGICFLTVLLLNEVFQFTDSKDFLILSVLAFLWFHTSHWYGGKYWMLRLSLQCTIWWWHLVFKVECVPQFTAKLVWLLKIKSIQELELDSK